MRMRIRLAEPRDSAQLASIGSSAFGSYGPPGFDDEAHQLKAMSQYRYFVVMLNQQILAGFYYQETTYGIHLLRLFVDPSSQRSGAGALVIKFLEDRLRFSQRIQLDADLHSDSSHAFYLKQGFELIEHVDYEFGSALRFSKTKCPA